MKYELIYNFMANAIRVLSEKEEIVYKKYKSISQKKKRNLNLRIKEVCPELYLKDIQYNEIKEEILTKDLLERLYKFIVPSMEREDCYLLIQLMENLDKGLSKRIDEEIRNCVERGVVEGLNTNIDQTGICILPRVTCAWERNGRGSAYRDELGQILHHIFYIDEYNMEGFKIKNIFIPLSLENQREKKIRIGISPLYGNCRLITKIEETKEGEVKFQIEGLTREEELLDSMRKVLQKGQDEKVDIIMMPEILGTRRNLDQISSELENAEIFDIERKNPSLIIMPSIWENRHNKTAVVNGYGEKLCYQEKHEGFLFPINGTKALEDIEGDRTICLFHMEGIGRFAILICKDFLTDNYRNRILTQLKTKLLFVPSFSTGEHDFSLISEKCKADDCYVVWCNTCSVQLMIDRSKINNLDTIAFVQKAGKYGSSKREQFYRCQECKEGKCRPPCLFVVELNL